MLGLLKIRCTTGISCEWMLTEFTGNEHSDNHGKEMVLSYPRRSHDDCSSVFVRHEVKHLRPLYQLKKMSLLQMCNGRNVESHTTSHENLEYHTRGSWNYFLTINRIHITSRGTNIFINYGLRMSYTKLRGAYVFIVWYLAPFDCNVYLENYTSQDICCITF